MSILGPIAYAAVVVGIIWLIKYAHEHIEKRPRTLADQMPRISIPDKEPFPFSTSNEPPF